MDGTRARVEAGKGREQSQPDGQARRAPTDHVVALQRFAGNRAVQRHMVPDKKPAKKGQKPKQVWHGWEAPTWDEYREDFDDELPRPHTHPNGDAMEDVSVPDETANRVTKKSLKAFPEEAGMVDRPPKTEGAASHSGWGKWTPEVDLRAPRSYDDERDAQVLRHLATSMYHLLAIEGLADVEVQAMFVNDRIFVATNDPQNLAGLLKKKAKVAVDQVWEQISNPASPEDDTHKRFTLKLQALLAGTRKKKQGDVGATLRLAAAARLAEVATFGAAAAGKAVNEASFKDRIVLVTGAGALGKAHAEQRLLYVLAAAGVLKTASAVIWGKKRPCMSCYLTFSFVSEVLGNKDISYDAHPGGFWAEGTTDGLFALIDMTTGRADPFTNAWLSAKMAWAVENGYVRSALTVHEKPKGKAAKRPRIEDVDWAKVDSGTTTDSDSEADDPPPKKARKK